MNGNAKLRPAAYAAEQGIAEEEGAEEGDGRKVEGVRGEGRGGLREGLNK